MRFGTIELSKKTLKKGEQFTLKVIILTSIEISVQPQDAAFIVGRIAGSLSAAASASDGNQPTYQWYSCSDKNKSGAAKISGATNSTFTIPTQLSEGAYYYFCRISATGATSIDSNIATVQINPVPTYVITYAAGGGSGTMESETAVDGQPFILPVSEFGLPSGKRFKAWSIRGVEYDPGDAYIFTADTTITALWENVTITSEPVTYRLPYRFGTEKGGIR